MILREKRKNTRCYVNNVWSERKLAKYGVGRLIHRPGTSPHVFYLQFKPAALSIPGILGRIAEAFAKRGISILQLKISASEPLRVIVIADMKGREGVVSEICGELRHVPYILEAWVVPPIAEGLAVDACSFPLTLLDHRAVIFRREVYEGLIAGGWERFGSGYGQLLYIVGFDAGRKAYADHSQLVSDRAAQLRFAEALFQMLGFGRLFFIRVDDSRLEAVVRVYDSFECELFRGAGEIRGNFIRGLIAGWLAARWHVERLEEVTAREVKCIARGDPYCQYWIRAEAKA